MNPRIPLLAGLFLQLAGPTLPAADLPPSLRFEAGPVNGIAVVREGAVLAVNRTPAGAGTVEQVLLTHGRRDLVEAAREAGEVKRLAPASSREFLEGTAAHWEQWWTKRFDYYAQQVTRRPVRDLPANHYLEDGERISWRGVEFRFLSAPGYTRDGGIYLADLDGVKVAFTGDLILAGGRIPDLYSMQEEIPEAKVGGYHGYLGRLGQWLASLAKLEAERPALIVPSRGPVITNPAADLAAASGKARAIYRNYLETNALHWYFGEERMAQCAARVLGPDHGVKGMPFAEHIDLPDWCQHIGTTKLLVSASGRGFVLDVGGPGPLKSLEAFAAEGLVKGIDGIFVTHVHNDHSAGVAEAAKRFQCPVYGLPEVAPVLNRPGDWFLPGLSANAVDPIVEKKDGETMRWEEFTFTFRSFPGQMLNHGALLVEKEGETPVFFIGDSFSPSGIDDYCLMNRNLMREDSGYLRCFDIVDSVPKGTWLVNQHIPHRFRFNEKETLFLLKKYQERIAMIAGFTSWDDPNYAIDEQWAWFHPYGQESKPGSVAKVTMRIWNHSTVARRFTVRPREPFSPRSVEATVAIEPRGRGEVVFELPIPEGAAAGVYVLTADVLRDDGVVLSHWSEALVKVVP
jgi:glyoxylase-like metal-dependent hydrolase (beta-lactamase superfamily II)